MTDCKNLDLARQWADGINAGVPVLAQAGHRAAAEVIRDLPDSWVDADKLREVVADHHIDMSEELMEALGALLPAPPAPRTMDEIEWDDAEHHLAEATAAWVEGTTSEVVMLHRHGPTIAVHQSAPHYTGLRNLSPAILTPTGRKYRLEPAESAPKGGPIETEFDPAYTYRDKDEAVWRYYAPNRVWTRRDSRGWNVRACSVPPAEYGPYTRIEDTK